MRTFQQFTEDAWGSHEQDQQLINQIEIKAIDLQRDINLLISKLSHGEEPVRLAAQRFDRELNLLATTFRTAIRKNIVSPEMSDHPPVSISQ
jgi:hypothetical protein